MKHPQDFDNERFRELDGVVLWITALALIFSFSCRLEHMSSAWLFSIGLILDRICCML